MAKNQRDYSPVHWAHYFDEAHDILIKPKTHAECIPPQDKYDSFRVYLRNFRQPFAPMRLPGQRLNPNDIDLSERELRNILQVPTLVVLHGGGYSGLTWAQFTKTIEQYCKCRVLAIDLRCHGDTKTSDDSRMDINTLIDDVVAVTNTTHQEICGFPETPRLVLIGHSMGGAIAIKCAYKCADVLPSLAGLVVIDVVEGTAKEALPLMMSVIKTRPTKFPSLANAIEWSVRSGMAKNADAARVSMPGNLVNVQSGELAIHEADQTQLRSTPTAVVKHKFRISIDQFRGSSLTGILMHPRLPLPKRIRDLGGASCMTSGPNSIAEANEDETPQSVSDKVDSDGYKKPAEVDKFGYTWRTNLAKTQPFWNEWFDGLSEQMLNSDVQGKFLLLAGIDRLDKALTIGQMQGKFMMKVLPKCGHAVHEDVPEQVASAITDFLLRNKFSVRLAG